LPVVLRKPFNGDMLRQAIEQAQAGYVPPGVNWP
jgi:hypothetical protein